MRILLQITLYNIAGIEFDISIQTSYVFYIGHKMYKRRRDLSISTSVQLEVVARWT